MAVPKTFLSNEPLQVMGPIGLSLFSHLDRSGVSMKRTQNNTKLELGCWSGTGKSHFEKMITQKYFVCLLCARHYGRMDG